MPVLMQNIGEYISKKAMILSSNPEDLFSLWFGKNTLNWHNPGRDGAKFGTLFDASVTLGQYAYRVLLMLVLYTCVITLVLHIAKFVVSMNSRAAEEAKTKITRVFIVALCCGTLTGFVAIVVKAFAV